MAGRPLRFLVLTGAGWTAIRVAALWPSVDPSAVLHAVVPRAEAEADAPTVSRAVIPAPRFVPVAAPAEGKAAADEPAARPVHASLPVAIALEAAAPVAEAVPEDRRTPAIAPPLPPTPPSATSRLSGSAWIIARGGSRALLGGQLGASQGGARLLYALGESRRLSLVGRVATPLSGRGREAALGIEWRPTRLSFRLVAEQRIAIDGGHGGPSVVAIGGINPTRLTAGFDVEAYGQAGGIVRDGLEGFADGAGRITHPVARVGAARFDLGLGAWGGVQRGASRVDVGPTVGLAVPVATHRLRLTLDWRERVAGHARPGSGPALSVGTDF